MAKHFSLLVGREVEIPDTELARRAERRAQKGRSRQPTPQEPREIPKAEPTAPPAGLQVVDIEIVEVLERDGNGRIKRAVVAAKPMKVPPRR